MPQMPLSAFACSPCVAAPRAGCRLTFLLLFSAVFRMLPKFVLWCSFLILFFPYRVYLKIGNCVHSEKWILTTVQFITRLIPIVHSYQNHLKKSFSVNP